MAKKHYTGKIVIKREYKTVNVMQEQLKTMNKIVKNITHMVSIAISLLVLLIPYFFISAPPLHYVCTVKFTRYIIYNNQQHK